MGNRWLPALGLVVGAMALGGGAHSAAARDLMVVGFGGGFQDTAREHLFEAYEAATGQPVSDDVYDGDMAKVYAMSQAGDVIYDIIMVEAPELVRGCEDGVFEPIDWTIVDKEKFIPTGTIKCGVGAAGWGAAMFYDKARHAEGPQTFAEFWDVETFPGKRSLRAGPKMTLEAALLADGVPADQVYEVLATPEGQDRAFAKLDEIKEHVIWWKSGAQPLQFIGSGEVDYATGYTGRIIRANGEGSDYELVWPTLLYSIDYWAVVKGSPMTKEAMQMIEWMTEPDPLRAQAAVWPTSPANAEIINDPAIREANPGMVLNHADEGLFLDTEFWILYGDDLEARFTNWAAQ